MSTFLNLWRQIDKNNAELNIFYKVHDTWYLTTNMKKNHTINMEDRRM